MNDRMKRKGLTAMLLMVACGSLLTACWDRREVNDVAFVLGSALDKDGPLLRGTVQIALPGQLDGSKGGGGGTSGGSKAWYVESRSANSIREIVHSEQSMLSRRLNFSHRRVLVIGEDVARDGIDRVMDALARVPQNRLTALLIVSKGPAYGVLAADTPAEQFPAEALRELAAEFFRTPRTLKVVIATLHTAGKDVALPVASLAPADTTKNSGESRLTVRVSGLAVFTESKLSALLEDDEARGALWLMGEGRMPEMTVRSPTGDGSISARFPDYTITIRPNAFDGTVSFRAHIRAAGSIVENESYYSISHPDHIAQVEHAFENQIRKDALSALAKLQQLPSDVVGFGNILHTKKPVLWQQLHRNWYDYYRRMKLDLSVEVQIENTGSLVKPFGIKEEQLE